MVIKEALVVSKEVLESEDPNMGTLEHAIRRIEMVSTQIVVQGYLGVYVDSGDFYDAAAELIHVEDTRGAVSEAQRALYEQKNV